MFLQAPAKINLTLKVLSKRADGYHEISSLMRAVRLFDKVEISLRAEQRGVTAQSPHIQLCSDMQGIPDGPANIAYRAAEIVLSRGGGSFAVEITLKKGIPAAAGLAGGSADAAAVLLGLAKELMPDADLSEIAALGASIGADIPFCVYACAAANPGLGYQGSAAMRAEGIGDLLCPVPDLERADVLLVKPPIEIPTKEVYALYDHQNERPAYPSDNDLESPCANNWPVVAETIATLKEICVEEDAGFAKVQLCGSGPTVLVYFAGGHTAVAGRVRARAEKAFPEMFVHLTETI